jgi:hypothetical protein
MDFILTQHVLDSTMVNCPQKEIGGFKMVCIVRFESHFQTFESGYGLPNLKTIEMAVMP